MGWLIGIGVVVVLLGGLAAFISSRPSTFRVERSALIGASPEASHAIVQDFRRWAEWSPWDKRDPNLTRTLDGPPTGEGAIYSWDGNKDVGAGRMTIIESKPGELVRMKLEFFRPFKGENAVAFTFKPEGDGARVSWIMDGTYNFITKGLNLVMDMDSMIGKDFEAGLANLDKLARGA